MADNTAYDISEEFDPVGQLDNVQEKLEARRKKKEEAQKKATTSKPDNQDAEVAKEAERKKRERERKEKARQAREEELAGSPWVTCSHKVKAKRVELLDRLYFRLKADAAFAGTKQDFYDEGLAMLESKYHNKD